MVQGRTGLDTVSYRRLYVFPLLMLIALTAAGCAPVPNELLPHKITPQLLTVPAGGEFSDVSVCIGSRARRVSGPRLKFHDILGIDVNSIRCVLETRLKTFECRPTFVERMRDLGLICQVHAGRMKCSGSAAFYLDTLGAAELSNVYSFQFAVDSKLCTRDVNVFHSYSDYLRSTAVFDRKAKKGKE